MYIDYDGFRPYEFIVKINLHINNYIFVCKQIIFSEISNLKNLKKIINDNLNKENDI